MKGYIAYKAWWIKHCYDSDSESAFEQHVNELGLYALMEKIVDWEDE